MEKKNKMLIIMTGILLIALFAVGFVGAWILCRVNHVGFGTYLWPIILCVALFAFTSVGFFMTVGKAEKIYGLCSIASAACLLAQIAIIF